MPTEIERAVQLPPDMPSTMKRLRRDSVGRPVPWFVADVDGVPDFRVMDARKIIAAIGGQLCFVCGERLKRAHGSTGPVGTFVVGPMCVINRTSAEPPNHENCAEWSAKACPFLTKPAKERREANLPDETTEPAGIMITRNPGVSALVTTSRWRYYRTPAAEGVGEGILVNFTHFDNVMWMARGKLASADEVLTSIETGLSALIEIAANEPGGMRALATRTRDALRWVPSGYDISRYPTIYGVLSELP